MRHHALRALLLIVPLALGTASAASAGTGYAPGGPAIGAGFCTEGILILTATGVQPNSPVRFQVNFIPDFLAPADVDQNVQPVLADIDVDQTVQANAAGFASLSVPMPVITLTFIAEVSGFFKPNPNDPDVYPFTETAAGDRSLCPDLPATGSDTFPIGKTALIVSLAGALLAVIGIRRRSRDEDPVTTTV